MMPPVFIDACAKRLPYLTIFSIIYTQRPYILIESIKKRFGYLCFGAPIEEGIRCNSGTAPATVNVDELSRPLHMSVQAAYAGRESVGGSMSQETCPQCQYANLRGWSVRTATINHWVGHWYAHIVVPYRLSMSVCRSMRSPARGGLF